MKERKPIGWIVFVGACLAVFLLGLFASSILERRSERAVARVQFLTPIAQWESDNAKWGMNFPREYNSWELTKKDDERTKFGGSAFKDYLETYPDLVVIWAGYPFAKEYNAPRGHFHALTDVTKTGRRSDKTPATCFTCKSPDVPRLMARDGVAQFYAQKFDHYVPEVKNAIGCADCHNNETMALQISRPALKEAFQRMGKDITKASHQEMRSLVCAQCHVEYYFKGKKENYLTFPWDDGLSIEDIEKYYDRTGHVDFVHAISGAKMIKMQHPDYEVYSKGIHAYRGVSCADCHMPYKTEGGIKYTDHQVRSPLLNISNSCQVCHRWSENGIRSRVEAIQTNHQQMLETAQREIAILHLEIGDAIRLGATDQELEKPRDLVRRAQMYWDYVAANNGMGFHAPQESARILTKALKFATDGRLAVQLVRAAHGAKDFARIPQLRSKAEAQAFIKPYVEAQKKASLAAPSATAPKAEAKPTRAGG